MADRRRPPAPPRSGTSKAKPARSPKAAPTTRKQPPSGQSATPPKPPRPQRGVAKDEAPQARRKPAMPRRAPRQNRAAASAASEQAPVSSTRIVARPPGPSRPSQMGTDQEDAKPAAWSRVAIATSTEVRKGPRDAGTRPAASSPLAATLSHSKASLGNVTMRVQERLKEQSKAQRRVSAVKWAKRAAYVGVGALAVWLLLLSPLFALDPAKVETSGFGTVVEPAAVESAVATHEGTSLALLNTGDLANEIRDVPGVRDVHIEREWPAGLAIAIESREPVAAVPDPDGEFLLMDDEAVQVGRSVEAPDNLPVIEVPVGEDNVRVLKSVLGVVEALPAGLSARVDVIKAKTEDSVTFTLRDGPRVEWGSSEQSALKARVLGVLLNSGEADDAQVIDVSAPTLPITSDGE